MKIVKCKMKAMHNFKVSLIMGISYRSTRFRRFQNESIPQRTDGQPLALHASRRTGYRSLCCRFGGWIDHGFCLPANVEEDRVSAMSAAMLSLGERIASELGRGGLEQVYIKGNAGFIVLSSVGSEAVLTTLARQEAKLGLIFLEMRRAAEDLVKLVG